MLLSKKKCFVWRTLSVIKNDKISFVSISSGKRMTIICTYVRVYGGLLMALIDQEIKKQNSDKNN